MITGDNNGNIYYADGSVVWRGTPDGTLTKFVSSGLSSNVQGLATDASDSLCCRYQQQCYLQSQPGWISTNRSWQHRADSPVTAGPPKRQSLTVRRA